MSETLVFAFVEILIILNFYLSLDLISSGYGEHFKEVHMPRDKVNTKYMYIHMKTHTYIHTHTHLIRKN